MCPSNVLLMKTHRDSHPFQLHANKCIPDIHAGIRLDRFDDTCIVKMLKCMCSHRTTRIRRWNDRYFFKRLVRIFKGFPLHHKSPVQMFTALEYELDICISAKFIECSKQDFRQLFTSQIGRASCRETVEFTE